MSNSAPPRLVSPRATYRLQLHGDFPFEAAAGLLDYLARLGVSHVYTSPVLQAAPGSTHGYDVVDHSRVSEDLGGEAGLRRLSAGLHARKMGLLLDVVPNHMAVATPHNRWWWDVLEDGPLSRYATYFDVDWDARDARFKNVVLLPVLGDHYGRALERGELSLARREGAFEIRYFEHAWPAAPPSVARVLAAAAERCGSDDLAFLAGAHERLADVDPADLAAVRRRHRDKGVLRGMLAALCSAREDVSGAVEAEVQAMNRDHAALGAIIDAQSYRIAFWRTAARDLAYRRFFDVNTLIGLRVETSRVFLDTHALVLGWLEDGTADGLRVDHPDGLRDPASYLRRLREARPGVWVVVEKILEKTERLPEDWPVDGTTGYEFMGRVSALFVDPEGEEPLTRALAELTGKTEAYEDVLRESKRLVLRDVLGSDVNRLTALLVEVCETHPRQRDYTRHDLQEAVRELVANFPVYRTYVGPEGAARPEDAAHIAFAIDGARRERPDVDGALLDFLGEVLRGGGSSTLERELVLRFQQLTSPAMAKGAEDTAFYRYNRLTSLNEVGGDPSRLGLGLAAFHEACVASQRKWPRALLATSTHDSKRSEDARARIHLLAEVPDAWSAAVSRWMERNLRHWGEVAPDRSLEYLFYQALVGVWPVEAARMTAYMEKAAREAKTRTSWTAHDAVFEDALRGFVEAVLADRTFVADLADFVAPLITPARVVSLGQVLIKMTAPGVPDLYQGTELWSHALVDPDNRRPVDYEVRRRLLEEVDGLTGEEAWARADEGLPKLWLIRQSLALRAGRPEAFGPDGAYEPIEVRGRRGDHVIAFTRGGVVAAIAPRFVLRLAGAWQGTAIDLPPGAWRNELTGEEVTGGSVPVANLLQRFPVALLAYQGGETRPR